MAGGRWHAGQSTDGGALIGPNPTDRGKRGTKKSVLVEREGGPLAVIIAGANVNDISLLAATLDAIVVVRPQPSATAPQHLCLDLGYANTTGRTVAAARGYQVHFSRSRGDQTPAHPWQPPRRWVVERTLAWLSKCRALLIRWDKHADNYLALLKLACALLWYRRYHRLNAVLR